MSHPHGTYLGSVRTLDDVRERCVIDPDTGCWHLRMRLSGKPAPKGGRTLRLHLFGRGGVSATKAVWELQRGKPLPKGRRAVRTCDSHDCCNPDHISAMTTSDAQRYIVGRYCDMTPARRAALHRMQVKRRRLSLEQLAEIRHSPESSAALARKFGVSTTTVWAVRAGRTYRDAGVGPASVWEMAA